MESKNFSPEFPPKDFSQKENLSDFEKSILSAKIPNAKPLTAKEKKTAIEVFKETLLTIEKDKGKTFFAHVIERAYKNDIVLIAIMKKLLPDLVEDKSAQEMVRTILIRNGAPPMERRGPIEAEVITPDVAEQK